MIRRLATGSGLIGAGTGLYVLAFTGGPLWALLAGLVLILIGCAFFSPNGDA